MKFGELTVRCHKDTRVHDLGDTRVDTCLCARRGGTGWLWRCSAERLEAGQELFVDDQTMAQMDCLDHC